MSKKDKTKSGNFRPVYADATENLRLLCRELNLPVEDALPRLQSIAEELSQSETHRGSDKSAPARKNDLQRVATQARRLWNTINSLDTDDSRVLNRLFRGSSVRITLDPPDPLREAFKPSLALTGKDQVYLLGDVLLTLEELANQVGKRVEGPQKGGRPQTKATAAMRIYEIARFAHHYAIPVGRNNRFIRLCQAVFHAADLNIDPEPGVKEFAGWMPDLEPVWAAEAEADNDQVSGQNPP